MKVELRKDDGIKVILEILFWKTAPNERRIVNGKELIDTTCQINIVTDVSPASRELTRAIARQNPIDDYNKIVGKKVALAKAIDNIAFLKPALRLCSIGERRRSDKRRRSSRQHIWSVFHQTFEKWN